MQPLPWFRSTVSHHPSKLPRAHTQVILIPTSSPRHPLMHFLTQQSCLCSVFNKDQFLLVKTPQIFCMILIYFSLYIMLVIYHGFCEIVTFYFIHHKISADICKLQAWDTLVLFGACVDLCTFWNNPPPLPPAGALAHTVGIARREYHTVIFRISLMNLGVTSPCLMI